MGTFKVIGMRRFEYTSKKTGRKMDACNLYCIYEDVKTVGNACTSIFCCSDVVSEEIGIGDFIKVFYNRFGSVEQVSKL